MDEILIEEKKYISSKRAAKITGYAKDYIGQLCREGRVPARLVGRSWYVLETAIQDHRFGNQEINEEEPGDVSKSKELEMPKSVEAGAPTWESPRYESSAVETLPTVNRLKDEKTEPLVEYIGGVNISDSWKEWFERVAEAESAVSVTIKKEDTENETAMETEKITEEKEIEEKIEEKPSEIPLQIMYKQPPQELLPHAVNEEYKEEKQQLPHSLMPEWNKIIIKTVHISAIVIATTTVILATLGSGYLDRYIISISPVSIIAGVAIYNK
jgi:hypothetical protein